MSLPSLHTTMSKSFRLISRESGSRTHPRQTANILQDPSCGFLLLGLPDLLEAPGNEKNHRHPFIGYQHSSHYLSKGLLLKPHKTTTAFLLTEGADMGFHEV